MRMSKEERREAIKHVFSDIQCEECGYDISGKYRLLSLGKDRITCGVCGKENPRSRESLNSFLVIASAVISLFMVFAFFNMLTNMIYFFLVGDLSEALKPFLMLVLMIFSCSFFYMVITHKQDSYKDTEKEFLDKKSRDEAHNELLVLLFITFISVNAIIMIVNKFIL